MVREEEKIKGKGKKWYKRWLVIVLIVVGLIIGYNVLWVFLHSAKYSPDAYVKYKLESDGYKVRYVSLNPYGNFGLVEMISLGNRQEQVWSALIPMAIAYPNASSYDVKILTPTQTCYYSTAMTNFNSYMKSLQGERIFLDSKLKLDKLNFTNIIKNIYQKYGEKLVLNSSEVDSITLYNVVHHQMEEAEICE